MFGPGTGLVNINIIGVVGDSRFRSVRTPIEPIMFQNVNKGTGIMIIRYSGDPAPVRAAVERQWKQSPTRSRSAPTSARTSSAELYKAEDARAQIFAAFSLARGDHRLPWPVRPRRLHRRAANQGDRHSQGARRANARHRPTARLAIQPPGHHRQHHRLAGRLVADARLVERVRPAHRADPDPIRHRRRPIALGIAIATVVGHAVKVARANPIHALRYE